MITAKTAKNRGVGRIVLGGVYNKFEEDGLVFDKRRRVDVVALDFNTTIPLSNLWINTEWAWVRVDVPESYSQQYGGKQRGGFVDFVRTIFGFEKSVLNAALRVEYVDWNGDRFNETGGKIRDDFFSVVPAISWRPTVQTVIRLNYRYNWQTDIFGNPPSRTAGFQLGFSSYF